MGYVDQIHLRNVLIEYYNEAELRILCADLDIDYENLGGRGKAENALELVNYTIRHEQYIALMAYVQRTRPHVPLEMSEYPPSLPSEGIYKAPLLPSLDVIPDPGLLPPGSRFLYRRNPQFTGRVKELRGLGKHFLYKDDQPKAAIVSGIGGIGKSQLAVEFACRYGRYFAGGVYWISFSDPASIDSEIAACSGVLSPTEQIGFYNYTQHTQVQLVQRAWQKPIPRLLIFDNLDDENAVQLLDKYRPKTGGCNLLITSRRDVWPIDLGAALLSLPSLPRSDSLAFLRQFIYPEPPNPPLDSHLGEIAEELGDLPLALHLAGSYLNRYRSSVTPVTYLTQLRTSDLHAIPSLSGGGTDYSPTGHQLHIAKTFALSYKRLDMGNAVDKRAITLLGRLAYFAPAQAIPVYLLTLGLLSGPPLERAGFMQTFHIMFALLRGQTRLDDTNMIDLEDALQRLSEVGLIERQNDRVMLHSLISAFVRQQPTKDFPQAAVEQALIDQGLADNNSGYPLRLAAWQVHLRHVTLAALQRKDKKAAILATLLGHHLNAVGDLERALPFCEDALSIFEKQYGSNHFKTAEGLNNLAALLKNTGELDKALPFLRRSLMIHEKKLGPNHPKTALILNNLAELLREMGEISESWSLSERALAITEKTLGADHPQTAVILNNQAGALEEMGEHKASHQLFERSLVVAEKALGSDHPQTALILNNLASSLQSRGDYEGDCQLFERVLTISEIHLGSEHPEFANYLINFASLMVSMGDFEKARSLYAKALSIYEAKLGMEHPSTQFTHENLQVLG